MDRIDDFGAVHAKDHKDKRIDALDIMVESLGIDDSAKMDLIEWIHKKDGHGQEGGFILGVLIGIIAHQNMIEKEN
jgi:hypothetical protein